MRKVVTSSQMRAIDRAAVEQWGIPGIVLMENAGRATVDALQSALPTLAARRVVVIAGKGNNGGDGFVICRHLLNRGINTICLLLGKTTELSGDARTNAEILLNAGGPLIEITDGNQLASLLDGADVIIDAILGTGLSNAPRGLAAEAIEMVNRIPAFILAVDIPSGLDADTGQAFEPAIQADLTVTMGLLKRGLLLHPGRRLAGRVTIADIGIPDVHLNTEADTLEIEENDIAPLLPERPPDGHKGSFGTVLVIAGSRGYSGAACLTGMAAVRSGAGLVKLAFPSGIADIIESQLLEAVKFPLPETTNGALDLRAEPEIIALAREADCIAIGPGIGAAPASRELVRRILPQFNCPMVIDADGLNSLAGNTGLLKELSSPAVLTPHPGEMARLHPAAAGQDRVTLARQFAAEHNITIVLKGAPTVIARSDGPVYLNPTGGTGLATGGTGDVLTGLIAGLIAQGIEPLEAAIAGVWLHGKAGDIGSELMTPYALAAGDLFKYLGQAFARLEKT